MQDSNLLALPGFRPIRNGIIWTLMREQGKVKEKDQHSPQLKLGLRHSSTDSRRVANQLKNYAWQYF